jgi:hypothetical protein
VGVEEVDDTDDCPIGDNDAAFRLNSPWSDGGTSGNVSYQEHEQRMVILHFQRDKPYLETGSRFRP